MKTLFATLLLCFGLTGSAQTTNYGDLVVTGKIIVGANQAQIDSADGHIKFDLPISATSADFDAANITQAGDVQGNNIQAQALSIPYGGGANQSLNAFYITNLALSFPECAANRSVDLIITNLVFERMLCPDDRWIINAQASADVMSGTPAGSFYGWVSDDNEITVRFNNPTTNSITPAIGEFFIEMRLY